jgi:chitin synthase
MMLPPMGFNAGPHAGSDYSQSLLPPQFPGMGAPRNTMMSLNSFAGSMPGPPSSYGGGNFPNQLGLGGGMGNARMSTFSLATTANLFGATPPSDSTDPTDDEILAELRHYLSSGVLMLIARRARRRTSRAAVFARFPKADLSDRVAWLNSCIDQILQGQ